ncbi:MAG: glycosyltransferase [Ancylobacter novellus]|uniref:Glycosyltransferase n=1 Tax=Ancylobacter novellus TaxID=921 RepID=A0A2W5KQ36_ANCNO|nr:MAG: glycosyltransferase [Ancylobacter novellus]
MKQDSYSGPERRETQHFLRIGGLEIPYATRERAIAAIDRSFEGAGPIRVAFCNANTMLMALDSRDYAQSFSSFLVLNDGVGVDLCSRLFNGRPFEQNLNGTDFVPALLRESRHVFRIFLLGGKPGVAEEAAAKFAEDHPRHSVVGTRDGYFSDEETAHVVAEINRSGASLVLVALGNPRQEEFVAAHGKALEAEVVLMVGALFDFVAGRVVRAPKVMRAARAEWLFRFAQEPRRLGRRYTVDVVRFLAQIAWLKAMRKGLQSVTGRRLRPEP